MADIIGNQNPEHLVAPFPLSVPIQFKDTHQSRNCKRGAFTDARQDKLGRFALAGKGIKVLIVGGIQDRFQEMFSSHRIPESQSWLEGIPPGRLVFWEKEIRAFLAAAPGANP